VGLGVIVTVGVMVKVGVIVGVVTRPVVCRRTKINAAPRPRIKIISPMAAGRLTFNSGNLGFWTGLVGMVLVLVVKVRPHTRQRVAFSLSLVPQVGQVFGVEGLVSGLMSVFKVYLRKKDSFSQHTISFSRF
jgi:hypothetical protein